MTVAQPITTTRTMSTNDGEQAGRTLIRWSAVFAGTLLGLATLALLTSLWLALARASNVDMIQRNIEWFIGASAVGCLFLAGLLARLPLGRPRGRDGLPARRDDLGPAAARDAVGGDPRDPQRLQRWAADATTSRRPRRPARPCYGALWGTFWTILGGFLAAGIGGAIGGAVTRDGDRIVRVDDATTATTTPERAYADNG